MKECILKEFKGYSNCKILLVKRNNLIFVKKVGNIERNYQQLKKLHTLGFNVPRIYFKEDNTLEMEYIHGINIKQFLMSYNFEMLLNFLIDFLEKTKQSCSELKNFEVVYNDKLKNIDFSAFKFNSQELIQKLPKNLPESIYHGDLTLENILFDHINNKFYFIDCVTIEYNSWLFDFAKLRQDLECNFFLRNEQSFGLNCQLKIIQKELFKKYPITKNDYLLILMLLRIYPYSISKKDISTQKFLETNINNLWK